MGYTLIKDMKLPPVLIGNTVIDPYIFCRSIEEMPATYFVVFHQSSAVLFGEKLGLPDTFLQHFLEMYLPEKKVGNITIIHSAPKSNRPVKFAELQGNYCLVLKPFTSIKDNKYKSKKNLIYKILMKIEISLQILNRVRSKELDKERTFCTYHAKVGYWNLFFKNVEALSNNQLEDLICQIPQ